MRLRTSVVLAIAVLPALSGCGSDDLTLVPVSGKVTHEGKPLAGAKVLFIPADPKGITGGAVTGPDGDYKAQTQGRSGIVAAKYSVHVSKLEAVGLEKLPDSLKENPNMARVFLKGTLKPSEKGKPQEVGPEETFNADVNANGGVFNFDVKKTSKS